MMMTTLLLRAALVAALVALAVRAQAATDNQDGDANGTQTDGAPPPSPPHASSVQTVSDEELAHRRLAIVTYFKNLAAARGCQTYTRTKVSCGRASRHARRPARTGCCCCC